MDNRDENVYQKAKDSRMQYLCATHSKSELRDWALRLRYFRFCRALSRHLQTDGDELQVLIQVESKEILEDIFAALRLPLVYRKDQNSKIIKIQQPNRTRVFGKSVFIQYLENQLRIGIADEDNLYEVSESSIKTAEQLEPLLASFAHLIIDPPRDDLYCVCPKNYPEFWKDMV